MNERSINQSVIKASRQLPAFALAALFALAFHYPRLFFIADEASRAFVSSSLIDNYQRLCKWDCGFYHYLANNSDLAAGHQFAAFFPAQPLFLTTLHKVFPSVPLSSLSIITSNVLSIIVIAAVILLGKRLWPRAVTAFSKYHLPLLLGLAVAVFPHAQFFSYGYPEPLFLSFYVCSALFIASDMWLPAALCAGLASVTRPQGLWILGAFLITRALAALPTHASAITQPGLSRKIAREALIVLLACTPIGLFIFWQSKAFGSPLAFLHVQSNWGRGWDLWTGLKYHIPKFDQCRIFILLGLISAFTFIRRPESHWKFIAFGTLFMTEIPLYFGGLLSYPRFTAVNFGIFVWIVEKVAPRYWLTLALLVIALTRLSVEVHSWITSNAFLF